MSVKLRIEQHFEFLSLKGGCTGSFESSRVKMPRRRGSIIDVGKFPFTFVIFLYIAVT